MRLTLTALSLAALTACGPAQMPAPPQIDVQVQRALGSMLDQPFDTGPVTVLTEEHGELHSYTLTRCGDAVCAGGRRGTLTETPDYLVISGTHAGRIFYLSPGGDGWVKVRGVMHPLAWDDPNPPLPMLAPTRGAS